jgi:hypothetical protein
MTVDNGANWDAIYMDEFENDDLIEVFKQIEIGIAKGIARYIIPVENVYILISGEDFDGEESSRLVAGGFLVLEYLQAGKVLKFIKGAKILTKTGQAANVGKRLMLRGLKSISENMVIDMATQFFINFVDISIENPEADAQDILLKSFYDIDVAGAAWNSLINYTSLNAAEKNTFGCVYDIFKNLQDNGIDFSQGMINGTIDCIIRLANSFLFRALRNNEKIKEIARKIAEPGNYDIIEAKLRQLLTSENLQLFFEDLSSNLIKKGEEVLWANE